MFEYDVEAVFYFMGNQRNKVYEGYRPAHMVREGYLTTGVHSYYNLESNEDEIKGTITFISPEDYPNCMWIGKKIEMYEGSKMVGYAIITEVLNSMLEKNNFSNG